MINFDDLYNAYYETDRFINISSISPKENRQYWFDIQKKNDMAYFVLIFARFDGFVSNYLENFLDQDEFEDMGFMKKVSQLVKKTDPDYTTIDDLYKVRCDIAHGRESKSELIDISYVCENLSRVADNISSSTYFMDS